MAGKWKTTLQLVTHQLSTGLIKHFYRLKDPVVESLNFVMAKSNKVVIEFCVVQFWSEITLVTGFPVAQ